MSDFGDNVNTEAVAAYIENGGEQFLTDPAMEADPNELPAQDDDTTPDPSDPLFRDLPDFSDLDPAQKAFLEKRVNDWRSDYTQKTTKLADANRILQEAGGNPQAVLDAYEFSEALKNDPEVRARLYQALQAEQGQQTPTPAAEEAPDPFSEYDLPPEILSTLKAVPGLEARLASFEQNQQAIAEDNLKQQYLREVEQDLSQQYNDVTAAYPDLLGENAQEAAAIEEEIFALAAHTNGNIAQAYDLYRRIESRGQARLYRGAANVPGGSVTPPVGGGHSTEPVVIETMKDASKAAQEFLEQYMQD
jgi:hypothetical protein